MQLKLEVDLVEALLHQLELLGPNLPRVKPLAQLAHVLLEHANLPVGLLDFKLQGTGFSVLTRKLFRQLLNDTLALLDAGFEALVRLHLAVVLGVDPFVEGRLSCCGGGRGLRGWRGELGFESKGEGGHRFGGIFQ